jgi:hypothetical protein
MKSLFVHIPKTAGTSVIKALGLQTYKQNEEPDGRFAHITFRHLFYHLLPAVAQEIGYKFCFTRNPYTRAISSWIHGTKCSKDFTSTLRSIKPRTHNRGIWGRQSLWLDGVDYDFIGRFENLEEDLRAVAAAIGVHVGEIPHLNKSTVRIKKRPADPYTDDARALVAKLYEEDFERCGYPI